MEISRIKKQYLEEMVPEMMKTFEYSNKFMVAKITKIVLSMGLGNRDIKKNTEDLTLIAGQKAIVTKAKKSVSQFKVRQGFDSGAMVTLRGNNMYHFIDRLINIALLNDRYFAGIPNRSFNFNKYVTLSLGIKDKRIFSEIKSDSIKSEGLNITICSNSRNKDEFKTLIKMFGLPIIGD